MNIRHILNNTDVIVRRVKVKLDSMKINRFVLTALKFLIQYFHLLGGYRGNNPFQPMHWSATLVRWTPYSLKCATHVRADERGFFFKPERNHCPTFPICSTDVVRRTPLSGKITNLSSLFTFIISKHCTRLWMAIFYILFRRSTERFLINELFH